MRSLIGSSTSLIMTFTPFTLASTSGGAFTSQPQSGSFLSADFDGVAGADCVATGRAAFESVQPPDSATLGFAPTTVIMVPIARSNEIFFILYLTYSDSS